MASQCQATGSSCSSRTADESCTTCFPSGWVDLWSPLGTSWGSSGRALVVMGQVFAVNFARTSCASSQPSCSDLFCAPGRHQTLAWRPRATSIWRSLPRHQTSWWAQQNRFCRCCWTNQHDCKALWALLFWAYMSQSSEGSTLPHWQSKFFMACWTQSHLSGQINSYCLWSCIFHVLT